VVLHLITCVPGASLDSTDDRISVDMGHSPALMRPYVPTAAAAPAAVYAAPAQYLPPPSYEQTEPVGGFSAGFVSPNANSRALGGSRGLHRTCLCIHRLALCDMD